MNGTGVPAGSSAHNASNVGRTILNDDEIRRALTRIAFEILESNKGTDHLVLIGIRSRGYPLAQRLAQRIQANDSNFDLEDGLGALDITPYRDDLTDEEYENRSAGESLIPAGGLDANMWFLLMMFCTPVAPSEPLWMLLTNTGVRPWCVLPCWWIAGTGNSQFAPTTWGRTSQPVPLRRFAWCLKKRITPQTALILFSWKDSFHETPA